MEEKAKRIASDANKLGIKKGDTLLIHSSLRSLGGATPEEFIKGMQLAVGEEGTLVFPALSYLTCNPNQREFDYFSTKSNVGAIPEYFRTQTKDVLRSLSPTHSCAAWGKNAEFVVNGHISDTTPCGPNSPFKRVMELGGSILFVGCGMRPNTSMHAVEELSEPDYLFGEYYEYNLVDKDGVAHKTTCRAHNFKGVSQRYERLADLLTGDELKIGNLLSAECHLVNTPAMWEKADKKYREDPHYFIEKDE